MGSLENLSKKTRDLKISDNSFINILLLGETGVGKSTFINSIANYLTYNDFKKAEKEKLIELIPSICKVQDKHGRYHDVQIGSKDKNECLETGMSATQDVKSYVFPIWDGKIRVRLIDTPGIGDVRGIDQDNVNCESILNYIGQLHELHAICYLFKPTNPRITVYFDYCMTQILSRLDKSASKNIIFIFTNTRGTDYGPGDTFASLQKVIDDIKARPPYVEIPMKKNVFCFDNEAFRYLAAIKQDIEFENAIKQRNYESWKKSAEQCNNLIKYITGDKNNTPLKPHFIKSTNAVNEARRLIVQLAQPLAEITELIGDNLFALQRHQEDLDLNMGALDELKKKLYMPVVDLKVTKLNDPVTVCAARKCAKIYKVGDTNKWHYIQRCHDPCYLTNVPKEVIGSPELARCAAMDPSTKMCRKCLCDFSTHMHIYYLTETVESKVVDNNIQKNINNKEKTLENARKLIADISVRKEELEKEHSTIIKACAKFAHFLQNNAITPFSDSYKEYVEYLIVRERSLGMLSKMSVICHLQKLLREYEAAKKSFDEALQMQRKLGEEVLITPQRIQETIQELYKLKHNGRKIKELYECQKTSRGKEHKNSEYVHKMSSQLPEDKNKKEKKDNQKNTNKQTYQKESNKPPDKNQKGSNQQRGRNQTEFHQRQRNRSPPPAYQDVSSSSREYPHYQGPNRPAYHYPPYDNSRPQHHSREGLWPDYRHPDSPGNYHPNYPPHQGYPLPPPPNSTYPQHDERDMHRHSRDGKSSSYEIKMVFNEPPQNRDNASPSPAFPPPPLFPPRDPYQQSYQPPYPPYNEGPHFGSRPPYPPHYNNPQHFGGRPSERYQRPDAHASRQNQRQPRYQSNTRNDGNNRGRGGFKGNTGQNPQKFKNQNRKKKNVNADNDSDTSSD